MIAVEKADAEESLSAALPALEEARLALSDLEKNDVTEIRLISTSLWCESDFTVHVHTGHLQSHQFRCRQCVSALLYCEATRKSTGRLQRE